MAKIRKVIKTGNSLAITIPAKTVFEMDIKEGDVALIQVSRSRATITYKFSGKARQLSFINTKTLP